LNKFAGIALLVFGFGLIAYLLSRNWKNVLITIGGWGFWEIQCYLYDWILWPIIQIKFGSTGILYLTAGAIIGNFLMLIWYQKKSIDWLGVNYLEEIKEKGHKWSEKVSSKHNRLIKTILFIPVKLFQLIIWLLNKNDIFAFIILSIWYDSFVTTTFLRHGKFGKLNKRDYKIFISSTILGCFVLSVIVGLGIAIFNVIKHALFNS